jgi:hypothetical protein
MSAVGLDGSATPLPGQLRVTSLCADGGMSLAVRRQGGCSPVVVDLEVQLPLHAVASNAR